MKSRLMPGALLACALCVGLLSGCSDDQSGAARSVSAASPNATHSASASLVDPLSEITNPASPVYMAKGITPLIHVRGQGPHTYEIARPTDSSVAVQFFVACAPNSKFVVTMGTFYAGPCANRFLTSGAIPVSASPGVSPLRIDVKVPAATVYWLVGIPYRKQ